VCARAQKILSDPNQPQGKGRDYNAAERPWFKVAEANKLNKPDFSRTTQLQAFRPNISLTAPYQDADGKGDLVSLAAPVQQQGGGFVGVVGIDLVVSSLRLVLKEIKTRETGETFVFHIKERKVLASQQLVPAAVLPVIEELQLLTGKGKKFSDLGQGSFPCADAAKNTSTEHGILLVWRTVWKGGYCIVMATSVDEIEAPITAQLKAIDAGATELFVTPLVLCSVCAGIILVVVVLLAHLMSGPLVSTAKDSKEIVKNIGGDLWTADTTHREVQEWKKRFGEVGEVSELRLRFDNLLADLLKKRNKSQPPSNPLMKKGNTRINELHKMAEEELGTCPDVSPAFAAENAPVAGGVVVSEVVVDVEYTQPVGWQSRITKWNTIEMQLRLKLIVPLMVSLLVIVVYASVSMSSRAGTWAEPVRAKLIEEETRSLDQRIIQRAAAVSESLLAGRNTVVFVQSYWKRLLDATHPWRDPAKSFPPLTVSGAAPSHLGLNLQPLKDLYPTISLPLETVPEQFPPERQSSGMSYQGNLISVEASAFWRPLESLSQPQNPPSVFAYANNEVEMNSLAHLDKVFRAAYFSADITNVYVGVHASGVSRCFLSKPC